MEAATSHTPEDLDFPLLDAAQVSEMLGGVPVKTIRNMGREGRLPSVVIGRRRLYSRRQVQRAVAEASRRGQRL
jgi:hypothetical protein